MTTRTHRRPSRRVLELDALQLPIWYRANDEEARRDPWLTVVYDGSAGLARAMKVTPSSPTVDEVLDCVQEALPIRGCTAPPVIQTDMSPLFTSVGFHTRVTQLGVDRYPAAYNPHPTGGVGVKVWFRNMCLRCLSQLSGYRDPMDPVPAPESADLVLRLQYSLLSPRAIEDKIRLWQAQRRPGALRLLFTR